MTGTRNYPGLVGSGRGRWWAEGVREGGRRRGTAQEDGRRRRRRWVGGRRLLVEELLDAVPQRRQRHRRTVEEQVQFQRVGRGEDATATVTHVPLPTCKLN